MNILFLTDGISPYVTGGMQQFAKVLVKLLLNQNCTITLVHCGKKGEKEFNEDIRKLFTNEQLNRLETVFIPFLNKGKWPGHYIYENKVYSSLIFRHFQSSLQKYDIVYAQGFTGWAFGKKDMKPKLLVNFHGFEMYQQAPSKKVKLEHHLLRPFVKQNCHQADYVYSFGGQITEIIKKLGIPQNKILNQSNGIESKWISEANTTNEPLHFIFIGRNERRKGIEELTEALLQLKDRKAFNFTFTFIGPIAPHPQLKEVVNYVGEIKDQKKIHAYLRKADVLVCPSHAEGMPTVILEAMANGLAIIASDVGACSKMVDGNGILLKKPTSLAIANTINQLNCLSDLEISAMKQRSLALVKSQFAWEVIVGDLVEDFREIINLK